MPHRTIPASASPLPPPPLHSVARHGGPSPGRRRTSTSSCHWHSNSYRHAHHNHRVVDDDIVRKKEVGPLHVLAAWLVMLVTLTILRQLAVPRMFADCRTVDLVQGFLLTVLRHLSGTTDLPWQCSSCGPVDLGRHTCGICAIATSVLVVGVYCVVDRPRFTGTSSAWGGRAKAK